jgi:hypothetical protein
MAQLFVVKKWRWSNVEMTSDRFLSPTPKKHKKDSTAASISGTTSAVDESPKVGAKLFQLTSAQLTYPIALLLG